MSIFSGNFSRSHYGNVSVRRIRVNLQNSEAKLDLLVIATCMALKPQTRIRVIS